MRLSTFGKPRVINCSEEFPRYLALPRGCYQEVEELFRNHHVALEIVDERASGIPLDAAFHGELYDEQKLAVQALLGHDTGVLSATTAFGKTAVGIWMIGPVIKSA